MIFDFTETYCVGRRRQNVPKPLNHPAPTVTKEKVDWLG